jgi:hypothetical protein
MIAFKDFAPQQIKPGGLLTLPEYEMFDSAVQSANSWIALESVQVLSIETVLLPNIWHSSGQGTGDPRLRTRSDFPSDWYQIVRVWYTTS